MRNSDIKEAEAARLAGLICNVTTCHQAQEQLDQMSDHEVQDVCTVILDNCQTILHMLVLRQKLNSLRSVLQRGVEVDTRNGYGTTPLLTALKHNALFSAKVLIDHEANVHEVVSRRKGTTLLHLMVSCDRPHAVLLLLEEKADANARDVEGRTPIHLAAILGNTVITAVLIRHEECDVNAADRAGRTALMLAVVNNNQELARQLVDAPRIDTVVRDKDGMASLHLAVAHGHLEVAKALLRRNTAHINGKEKRMGRTPMHFACTIACNREDAATTHIDSAKTPQREEDLEEEESHELEDMGTLSLLALVGSDTSCPDSSGVRERTNEMSTVRESTSSLYESPEQQSSGSSAAQESSGTGSKESLANGHPSHSTARKPRAKTADSAKQLAATPRSVLSRPKTHAATTSRTKTPKERFVEAAHTVKKRPVFMLTPRMRSKTTTNLYSNSRPQSTRHSVAVKESIRHNVAVKESIRHSIAGEQLQSPRTRFIHKPSTVADGARGRASSIQPLSRHRPSTAPVSRGRFSDSVFSLNHPGYKIPTLSTGRESAASHRSRESSGALILTPRNVAVIRCRIVALLLENGADANLMTNFRRSPLHMASALGQTDVVLLLLKHVTNPNVLSRNNKTALHLAAEGGYTTIVQHLVHAGANLALRDINGMSAMHLAAARGHAAIVAVLLRAGAEKNVCDFGMKVPLHHACLHGHAKVIELLVRAGAVQNRQDVAGFLPIDYLTKKKKVSTPTPPTSDIITEEEDVRQEEVSGDSLEMEIEKLKQRRRSKYIPATALCPTSSFSSSHSNVYLSASTSSSDYEDSIEKIIHFNEKSPQPQLPPASTAEGHSLARVAAANKNTNASSSGGCEAVQLADQLMASARVNDVNGSVQSDMLRVAPQPRRRKTGGVFRSFTETSAGQAVSDSGESPIPKVLYSGIPQAT